MQNLERFLADWPVESTQLTPSSSSRLTDERRSLLNISFRLTRRAVSTSSFGTCRSPRQSFDFFFPSSLSLSLSLSLCRSCFEPPRPRGPSAREAHQLMEMRSSDENDINQNICLRKRKQETVLERKKKKRKRERERERRIVDREEDEGRGSRENERRKIEGGEMVIERRTLLERRKGEKLLVRRAAPV